MASKNLPSTIRISRKKADTTLRFPPKTDLKESKMSFLSPDSFHFKFTEILRRGNWFHTFAFGEIGEGKSNALEVLAEHFNNQTGELIIDASGKNYEGAFWCKTHKVYLVYPSMLKPRKKSIHPNVVEVKLNKKNTWEAIINRAKRYKKIVVLMCRDPLAPDYLKALNQLFRYLDTTKAQKFLKTVLLRELSFVAYRHGQLKATTSNLATDCKRLFLKIARMGRHNQIRLLCDAQLFKDVDSTIGENVALKIIKRTESQLPDNFQKPIAEKIKTLQKHQMICKFQGKVFTGILRESSFHKQSDEFIEDLYIWPVEVEKTSYNRAVENRYIDRVAEFNTNVLGRLVLGRRRHLKDPENSKLSTFEIADLLMFDCKIELPLNIQAARLVYAEIKFRNPESTKHNKIEISDVRKTIQDLNIKRILWDYDKQLYFWHVDREFAQALNWRFSQDKDEIRIPCLIEMYCPLGATKGAKTLCDKHHITVRAVKIPNDFYE